MSESDASGISQPIFREIGVVHRERTYLWRSPRPLAVALTGALIARVALNIALGAGVFWRIDFLNAANGGAYTDRTALMADARSSDQFVQLASSLGTLSLLPCYVLACFWIYRAAANARALGARRLTSTPGWAVGWYAVPLMAWFRPFTDMSEIWKARRAPQAWASERLPWLLVFWWAAWVLTNLGGYVALLLAGGSGTVTGLLASSRFVLLDLGFDTASAVLFLTVVWRVSSAQLKTRQLDQSTAEIFA